MNTFIRKFYLLHTIRQENKKGNQPSLEFLISNLNERFSEEKLASSNRTISRDLKEIRNEFKIDISYENRGYKINDEDFQNSILTNTIEALEIFTSVNFTTGMPDFVIAENRKPTGLDNFHFFVKAILENSNVGFFYQKYFPEEKSKVQISPYALKESKNRWYLIGVKKGENELKSFGLDRITLPAKEDSKFKPRFGVDEIEQHFVDSFAMFTDGEIENIKLKFDKRDGNYIQSFPIHSSQKIEENENSVTVHLKIRITLDFMMELMSRAWSVEVLEPIWLREKLAGIFKEAVERNL